MLLYIVNNIYVAWSIHDSFPCDQKSTEALNRLKNFIVSNFKKSNMADFKFGEIHIANGWYFHLHKTFWSPREADSSETNPAANDDVILSRSRDF